MANRFWVGGGSANTWAATGNTNWALTSGAANNASVPTTTDVAIFDSNSGVGNSVIGANITVQGLDCTGGTGDYAGTITHNTSVTLTINTGAASSLRFSSGMTYTPASTTSIITFTHTTGTANITSNGKRLFALTINGVGGTTALLDALLVNAGQSAIFTLTNGIFDANGFAFTAILVSGSNSNTRSMIFGSAVTLGGNAVAAATIWNFSTTTGLTFTKNSANIEILAPTSSIAGLAFAGGGLTYNDLTLDITSNQTSLQITGGNTFAHLVNAGGWNLVLPSGATTTVSSAATWTGTQANPILVYSSSAGSLATLSCPSGTFTLTWGGLQGITAQGGATFTATNVFNHGSNSGWAITPPADSTTAVPTVAQIAAAVWQDTTAGHFTTAGSIGKDLFVGGIAPGAAGGHFIAGSNAATTVNITGTITTATNVTTVNGLAADSITAASLATDAGNEIADALLNRDMSTGTDSGSTTVRTVRQALRFLRNKWSISGSTITVTKEDDSTASWTGAISTDSAQNPVSGINPAGGA